MNVFQTPSLLCNSNNKLFLSQLWKRGGISANNGDILIHLILHIPNVYFQIPITTLFYLNPSLFEICLLDFNICQQNIFPVICLSISIHLSIYISIYPYIYQSIFISIYLSIYNLSIHISISPYIYLSIYIYIFINISNYPYL